MSTTPATLMGGKYRLLKQLGEGAMGVVWSAQHTGTGAQVAIKLILRSEPELRHRLIREAQACGAIRHKNVVQVYDVGSTDTGDPFLVMELLQGETLAALLARKRRLPPFEAASIARDVARALAAAHQGGIVHRDLKPANIFLHAEPGEDTPVVKVVDFGVSKNLQQSDGLRTVAGGAVGSPMYMSPEQARAERDLDGRADLWSLGVVLYEMLTGERPFAGDAAEVLHRILNEPVPRVARRIRKIDPDLDRLVDALLTRDRDQRLGPAAEVAKQLEVHTLPAARGPLPSLMDGAYEAPGVAGPGTGGGALSPGLGRPLLQPGSPGFGPTDLRPPTVGSPFGPSMTGYGSPSINQAATSVPPSSGPPVPSTQRSASWEGAAGHVDQEDATRPLQARMLDPMAQSGSQQAADWAGAGGGTIPIHLHSAVMAAQAYNQPPAPPPAPEPPVEELPPLDIPPVPTQGGTLRMDSSADAHQAASQQSGAWQQQAPAPVVPVAAGAPPRRDRAVLAALGIIAFSSIAAVLIWRFVLAQPPANAGPAPSVSALLAAVPSMTAPAPTAVPTAPVEPTPTVEPSAALSAEPSAEPSTEPSAAPSQKPVASTPPPTPKTVATPPPKPPSTGAAKPAPTTKPACKSKFSVNCRK